MHESEDNVEFKSARHNYPYSGGKKSDPSDRRHCMLVEKEGNRYKLCSTYYEFERYTRQFENQDNPTSTRQVPQQVPQQVWCL